MLGSIAGTVICGGKLYTNGCIGVMVEVVEQGLVSINRGMGNGRVSFMNMLDTMNKRWHTSPDFHPDKHLCICDGHKMAKLTLWKSY
jgi:hypothetical protein